MLQNGVLEFVKLTCAKERQRFSAGGPVESTKLVAGTLRVIVVFRESLLALFSKHNQIESGGTKLKLSKHLTLLKPSGSFMYHLL